MKNIIDHTAKTIDFSIYPPKGQLLVHKFVVCFKGNIKVVNMEGELSELCQLILEEKVVVLRETIKQRTNFIDEAVEIPVQLIRQHAPDIKIVCGIQGEDTSLPLLHIAAAGNCVQSIHCLLDLGCNIDHQASFTRSTALSYAALNNHLDSVKCLLERNCDINNRAEYNGDENCNFACANNSGKTCSKINTCDHESNNQLQNKSESKKYSQPGGVTPLVLGAQNAKIVLELLQCGAKVHSVCEYDRGSMHITALGVAIKAAEPESVRLLLEAGASVSDTCEFNHNHTALDMAICCCKYPKDAKYTKNMFLLVNLLISYGADPNIVGHDKTLLQNLVVADRSVDIPMMTKLYHAGADMEKRYKPEGHTLLSMSILHGKTDQVKMLLNLNCKTDYEINLDKNECDQGTENKYFSPIDLSLFLSEKDIDWATSVLTWDPDFFLFLTRQLSIAEMLLVCGAKPPTNMCTKLQEYRKRLHEYHHSGKVAVKALCNRLDQLLFRINNCLSLEDLSTNAIRKTLLLNEVPFEPSIFHLGLPKTLVEKCFLKRLQPTPLPKRQSSV